MNAPSSTPPHVLVIDDEESMRHALAKGFQRAGFTSTEAATGKDGVDRFVEGRFDAVLTDVKLPDLSGLDIVAILTEMDARIPVVVMTGYGTVEMALEAMRRGAKDYVQKPFSVDEVVRVIQRAVDEERLSRENRRLRALVERRLSPDGYQAVEEQLEARRDPLDTGELTSFGSTTAEIQKHEAEIRLREANGTAKPPMPLREAQRKFEIRYVEDLLARTGGNVAASARLAGISRPNFHKKLRTLGVDANRFKRAARRGRTHDM